MWWRTRWTIRSRTGSRRPEPVEERAGEVRAHGVVPDEVPVGERRGLADVVEQRREPDDRPVGPERVDGPERVVPQVLARDLVLGDAALCREVGREMDQQVRIAQQPEPDGRDRGGQQLVEFGGDPLARQVATSEDRAWMPASVAASTPRSERRREPDRPDHPERVLFEARPRIADRAEDTSRRVGAAAVRIHQGRALAVGRPARVGAPGHRVDREVAAREVGLDGVPELDPMRAPEVGVVVVLAERRDLDVAMVGRANGDGPEPVLVDRAGEERLDPVRPGVGGEIPVVRLAAEHDVADRAAHDIRGVAVRPQGPEHVQDGPGDGVGDPSLGHGRSAAISSDPGTGTSARRRCGRRPGTA